MECHLDRVRPVMEKEGEDQARNGSLCNRHNSPAVLPVQRSGISGAAAGVMSTLGSPTVVIRNRDDAAE